MISVLVLFTLQCLLGAFDNFWHHELQAQLPREPRARLELALHTTRELLYALIFLSIAWWRWEGLWTLLLVAILAIEMAVTIWDFVVEDRTRQLPALERVLHTVLALNYGALLALWAPELQRWALAPTAFGAADYGLGSWLMTLFGGGVLLWGLRDLLAVARLGVPEWQRRPIRAGSRATPRVILITGATGFIGRALTRRLVERGDHVIACSRHPHRARDLFGPKVEICGDLAALDATRRIDAVVNLAGEAVAGGWWTQGRRRKLLDSRLQVTAELLGLLQRLQRKPEVLVNASAIGYYGDRGDEMLHEGSVAGEGFLTQLCDGWEAAARRAECLGIRVCRLRIGLVLGTGGGVLPALALAARCGAALVLGNGRQWQSWIHLRDLLRLIALVMERMDIDGAINAVAPVPLRQRDFVQRLARVLRRPLWLRMPAALLRLMAGQMADLFLVSQRVLPERLQEVGFQFAYPEPTLALEDLLRRQPHAERARRAAEIHVNQDCPVCRTSLAHFERAAVRTGCEVVFRRVDANAVSLVRYGVTEADLRRRLFVRSRDGELRSGVDAFILIWRCLPGYRWLAAVIALPGVYHGAAMIYDLLLSPLLQRWNEGRARNIREYETR